MSNEYKDWLDERYSDVLLEDNIIDNVLYTIYLGDWCAIVHGTKVGVHKAYRVWFDDENGWNYELSEN